MCSEVTDTTSVGQACYSCGGRGSRPVGVPGFLEEELCVTCDGSGVIQMEGYTGDD